MSQSQSFSGKICVHCSKSNFILDNDKISYANSGASIQTDTYRCPYCELKIKHRWVKQLPNRGKVQEVTVARNPLSNLSMEKSINPLKIPV
jgi:DNA-directed RNA polymerase subunit RPC12/RpoP